MSTNLTFETQENKDSGVFFQSLLIKIDKLTNEVCDLKNRFNDIAPIHIGYDECEKITHYKKSYLRFLVCLGLIPHKKLGVRVTFDKDEILLWLESGGAKGLRAKAREMAEQRAANKIVNKNIKKLT